MGHNCETAGWENKGRMSCEGLGWMGNVGRPSNCAIIWEPSLEYDNTPLGELIQKPQPGRSSDVFFLVRRLSLNPLGCFQISSDRQTETCLVIGGSGQISLTPIH